MMDTHMIKQINWCMVAVILVALSIQTASAGQTVMDAKRRDNWQPEEPVSATTNSLPALCPTRAPGEEYSVGHTPPFELNYLPAGGKPIKGVEYLSIDTSLPDLNVAFIHRSPAYEWDQEKKWPDPGEIVTFTGHIANRGESATSSFAYAWYVDGAEQSEETHPGLAPGAEDTVTFTWSWDMGSHTIRLNLDTSDQISEISKSNNEVEDRTDALSLGIYVEQSFYDFFNENVWQSGWGGNSFDDWVQRHVGIWNQLFTSAMHPLTPDGVLDRVRLDKVVRVPDGDLNCSSNRPADDNTVDLIWGFISEMVGVPSDPGCPHWTPRYRDDTSTWDRDMGILHELSHARYLIDLYGFNVGSHEKTLAEAVGSTDETLELSEIPDIPEFHPPANLVIDGELILCNGKVDNTFTNCTRGYEGTTARSHAAGATVFADQIHVQDGLGNALTGGPGLPAENGGFYWDPYFGEDLMNAGSGYGEHSAFAWNRIAGQRPVCGNYNAPCNIGEYLNDIPDNNIVELRWPDGTPIESALVEVFQAKPYPIWYGKTYASTPDLTLLTDESGRADLGSFPFGDTPPVIHGYSHSNGVLLLKTVADHKVGAQFLEVTEFNIAYWSGDQQTATYPITFTNWAGMPASPPEVDFGVAPIAGVAPLQVTFTMTPTGGPSYYQEWQFGDGGTSVDESPTHVYTEPGSYRVSVLVAGPGGGGRTEKEDYIRVYERAQASFSASPTSGEPPLSVAFTNISTGDYETCLWDFGDSTTSADCNDPSHNYLSAGTYDVALTVDGLGGTDTLTRTDYIRVASPPAFQVYLPLVTRPSQPSPAGWTAQDSGTTAFLKDVFFADDRHGWVVGHQGAILYTPDGGSTWTPQDSGGFSTLEGIHCANLLKCWAVGDGGKIVKTTNGGEDWNRLSSGTTSDLDNVFFVDEDTGWAVGYGGTILKTINGGENWDSQDSGTDFWLWGVHFLSQDIGWVSGGKGSGVILRTSDGGDTWLPTETVYEIADLYFVDAIEGWAVTNAASRILHSEDGGVSWMSMTTPATLGWLTGVCFMTSDEGWVTGASGSIFHTMDRGSRWNVQTSHVSGTLQSVYFPSSRAGWIVGEKGTILKYDS